MAGAPFRFSWRAGVFFRGAEEKPKNPGLPDGPQPRPRDEAGNEPRTSVAPPLSWPLCLVRLTRGGCLLSARPRHAGVAEAYQARRGHAPRITRPQFSARHLPLPAQSYIAPIIQGASTNVENGRSSGP